MDWIEPEFFGFICPCFADRLVWGEAFEGLEPSSEIIDANEVSQMRLELLVAVVVVTLDGGLPDGAVHPLNLIVGPWMFLVGPRSMPFSWHRVSRIWSCITLWGHQYHAAGR